MALADREQLETENNTLYAKLSDGQSRSNKLEKENTDLTASLKTATAALGKAEDTIKLNDEIFAELSRRNVAWRELITKWATLPDIKAKVVRVDTESNFVLLNVGQKQGVKKNYEFSIFRDGTFVAKVNVFDVQDDLCAARDCRAQAAHPARRQRVDAFDERLALRRLPPGPVDAAAGAES